VIAKVIVDLSLDREFDYSVPPDMAGRVRIGSRVRAPFGRRHTEGYVVGLTEASEVDNLKPLHGVVGAGPYLDDTTLALVRWMSGYYYARLEQCLRTVLPGAVRRKGDRFKKERIVCLISADPIGETGSIPPERMSPAQRKLVAALHEHGGELSMERLLELTQVTEAPVKTLVKHGFVRIEARNVHRDPFASDRPLLPTAPLALMPEQTEALTAILAALAAPEPRPILLHGVTGSGKTEVYLQGIAAALAQGRGAIVLVPEIALTPQTVERFRARFGARIAVLHSHLSDGERHDEWHRIRGGGADVVIGARSAVFAPVRNLGLIVVDEEHEPSYKQSEAPRYNARDVAVMRAHLLNCAVVLGSATPAMESWANTRNGKYTLCTLTQRADYRSMPAIRVLDMRIEAERTGHANVFAGELLEAIQERLRVGEQTLLFLNRRGFASSLICVKCGFVSECHQCSIAHTYHRVGETLRCHLCGEARAIPSRCPACGDPAFRHAGFGTQRVEDIVRKCFPSARVARLDADTAARKRAYDDILGAYRDGQIDILVGTQMIAKGLHFPNVTLVGSGVCRHEPAYSRFQGRGAHVPTDCPGGRPGWARGCGRSGHGADLHSPSSRDPVGPSPRLRRLLRRGTGVSAGIGLSPDGASGLPRISR
jgi:primosomal protein N' (replication factor Y) (superfamily II helicase)